MDEEGWGGWGFEHEGGDGVPHFRMEVKDDSMMMMGLGRKSGNILPKTGIEHNRLPQPPPTHTQTHQEHTYSLYDFIVAYIQSKN